MYKTINNRGSPIENNIINEEINNGINFALMIEQDDGSYIESTSTKWPENYKLNIEKSKCVDKDGNELNNLLKNVDNLIQINTTTTSYCYLYFDNLETSNLCVKGENLGTCLINNKEKLVALNESIEGGLYRYQGTNKEVYNYVCFGIDDRDTCINNIDKYMYRIIGVNVSGQVKLIKQEALNNTMQWGINSSISTTWPNSVIYKNIHSDYYLTNDIYMSTDWLNKISDSYWPHSNLSDNILDWNNINSAVEAYSLELGYSYGSLAKIGLLYVHDYFYSSQSGGLNCNSKLNIKECKLSWLHLSNNDTSPPCDKEFILSQSATSNYNSYVAGQITSDGSFSWYGINGYLSIRPVFYLTSEVEYVSGIGTIDDPYIIN